ncbi:MAG TPA: aminodeoxychorismate/anthranilate synthase component II [bacterium]|nr:aminodeoxychorismate/anthranilate synthase component II [bacterium]
MSNETKIRLLLIDNKDSFTYNIVEILRKLESVDFTVLDVEDIELTKIEHYDRIIISPGPELPKNYPALGKVIDRYKNTIPILGICLGHQAIATNFGAKLVNLDTVYHGDQQIVKMANDSIIFMGLPTEFKVGLYHSWIVERKNLPDELKITAYSSKKYIMAIEHTAYNIYGVQFHPESFLTRFGSKIIDNFINKVG